jgi:hypothetical protein
MAGGAIITPQKPRQTARIPAAFCCNARLADYIPRNFKGGRPDFQQDDVL